MLFVWTHMMILVAVGKEKRQTTVLVLFPSSFVVRLVMVIVIGYRDKR